MTIAMEMYNEVHARGRIYKVSCSPRFYIAVGLSKLARFDSYQEAFEAREHVISNTLGE